MDFNQLAQDLNIMPEQAQEWWEIVKPTVKVPVDILRRYWASGDVMIGVPCGKWQSQQFLMCLTQIVLSAPLHTVLLRGGAMTDINQNNIVHEFLEGNAEYLFLLEDDVIPKQPKQVIRRLRGHNAPVVAGLYFNGSYPYTPHAYYRQKESGLYGSMKDWTPGEIREVDAIGTGIVMIHRSVFDTIRKRFRVKVRKQQSILERVFGPFTGGGSSAGTPEFELRKGAKADDEWHGPLPYFLMNWQRTSDFYFCELLRACNIPIVVDTGVVCDHMQLQPVTQEHFEVALEQAARYGRKQTLEQVTREGTLPDPKGRKSVG